MTLSEGHRETFRSPDSGPCHRGRSPATVAHMTNTQRAVARLGLIFAALIAGVLNGSVIAAPALMLVAYLLALLVRYGQEAVDKFERERFNRIQEAGAR